MHTCRENLKTLTCGYGIACVTAFDPATAGEEAYAWSRSRMGGWRVACSPILGTTVTINRLKQRGYIPFEDLYRKVSVVR